jgi:hypothetical protein
VDDGFGNITETTYDFEHFQFGFGGFFQPIDNNNLNLAKAGQTIPVKWRLLDGTTLKGTFSLTRRPDQRRCSIARSCCSLSSTRCSAA